MARSLYKDFQAKAWLSNYTFASRQLIQKLIALSLVERILAGITCGFVSIFRTVVSHETWYRPYMGELTSEIKIPLQELELKIRGWLTGGVIAGFYGICISYQ